MPALGGVNSTTSVATSAELAAHTDDATAAHAASAIAFTPAGTVAATTVQAAIEEVAAEASGSGIPQGGPLTETLYLDIYSIRAAEGGVGEPGSQARLVAGMGHAEPDTPGYFTALGGSDAGAGGEGQVGGGYGIAGQPGGNVVLMAGAGDAENDDGASITIGGGDGVGGAGAVAIVASALTLNGSPVGGIPQGGPLTEPLDADGNAITGLADPSNSQDAATKDYVDTEIDLVRFIQNVTIDLDAADIATLNSVPVQVVAAPGAGKVIVPVRAVLQIVAGVTPFTTGEVGATLAHGAMAALQLGTVDVNDDIVAFGPFIDATSQLGTNDADNAPLNLETDADPTDPGGADGTARLTVLYYVFDLAV